jgi:L-lactate dehydrogenase complex protein LldG
VAPDSRAEILERLRRAGGGRAPTRPPLPPPPVDAGPAGDLLARFAERAGAARATVERVGGLDEVPAAVARYLAAHNLPARLTVAPELRGRLDFADAALDVDETLPLADGAAVLAGCAAAVAETGTLVAVSGPGIDPRLDYLAETLIVLVGAGQVLGVPEEVWARLRTGANTPRLVSFITGPSRTADIEQTIEWGAHGPRRLHVLIADETP